MNNLIARAIWLRASMNILDTKECVRQAAREFPEEIDNNEWFKSAVMFDNVDKQDYIDALAYIVEEKLFGGNNEYRGNQNRKYYAKRRIAQSCKGKR